MYIKYWLLFPLLSWLNIGVAQNYIPYYNLVNEAKYWLYKKEYKKAEKLYKRAFSVEEPFADDSYTLAKCYAFQKKKKLCRKWLEKSCRTPISFTPYVMMRTDQIECFQKVFNEKGELNNLVKQLKKTIEQTDKKYKDSIYYMLQDTLFALCKQDQFYRKNMTEEQFNSKDYWKLVHQNDWSVQQKLLALIKEYGYPGYPRIGTDKGDQILVHILGDEKVHNIFKEILYKELQKGNILPFGYAYMMDRWNLVTNNSCYLSMRIYTQQLCTESDYDAIVQRRKEIGLSIYFTGQRRKISSYNLHPWVNDEFVKKHSFLNKKCK